MRYETMYQIWNIDTATNSDAVQKVLGYTLVNLGANMANKTNLRIKVWWHLPLPRPSQAITSYWWNCIDKNVFGMYVYSVHIFIISVHF